MKNKKLYILQIPPSETIAINTIAIERKKAGETIYNLSAGEPMIDAPDTANLALIKSLEHGHTHYPPVFGLPDLRDEAANWMNRNHGSEYKKANTLVVNGGKFGIYVLLQALLRKGDEVLIPAPYWVSYTSMTSLFGGVPKVIETEYKSGWKITTQNIIKNANKKTKILFLNNAGNPTGVLYSKKEIENILITANKLGIFVISDEVYSGLVYDDNKFVSCSSFTKYSDNVAIIQSCSKSFAMTGFRIGFVFASPEVIHTLGSLVSQSTSGVTTMCQYATLAVLKDAKNITKKVNAEMKKRRDTMVNEINKAFKINIKRPVSGLYIFAPLSSFGWKGNDSSDFVKQAIEKSGVALVHGSAFGAEGYVRFSFGERPEVLKLGIQALSKWLKNK